MQRYRDVHLPAVEIMQRCAIHNVMQHNHLVCKHGADAGLRFLTRTNNAKPYVRGGGWVMGVDREEKVEGVGLWG